MVLAKGLIRSRVLRLTEYFARVPLRAIDSFLRAHSPNASPLHCLFDFKVLSDFDGYLRYWAARKLSNVENGFILDVGGGEGQHFGVLFGRTSIETVALNISLQSLRHPRNAADNNVLADACHLPFRGGALSLSLCMEVLHQLPMTKRKTLLAEIKRVSKHISLQDEIPPSESAPMIVSSYRRIGYWRTVTTGERSCTSSPAAAQQMAQDSLLALTDGLENCAHQGKHEFLCVALDNMDVGADPSGSITGRVPVFYDHSAIRLEISLLRHHSFCIELQERGHEDLMQAASL